MNRLTKITGLPALLTAAAVLPVNAEVAINDYLSVDGYAAATAAFTKASPGSGLSNSGRDYSLFDSEQANMDAVLLGINGKYRLLGGRVSLLYVPDNAHSHGHEAGILDAYVSISRESPTGVGFSVKGGKFLSNFGYESFYANQMNQISYGLITGIPGYATGIDANVTIKDKVTIGASITDSLYSGNRGFYAGDADVHNLGYMLYLKWKISDRTQFFAGIGYDTKNDSTEVKDEFVFDAWLSHQVTPDLEIAGELTYSENEASKSGVFSWLAFAKYTFPGLARKASAIARLSGAHHDDDLDFVQFSVGPEYAFTQNFRIRGEFSWIHASGDNRTFKNGYALGVQAIFQF
ncbi:MAG: porin [Puniceicoccales bacterium]|jgi:hypothetical protein|nr:porin [Puniceicoccales bacterium]